MTLMLHALTVVAAWLLLGADDSTKHDPLAGTWVVVSTTSGGKDDTQLKDFTATFIQGKVTFRSKDGKVQQGDLHAPAHQETGHD